jgi:hypothetical protein
MDGRPGQSGKTEKKFKGTAECDLKKFKHDFPCEFDAFCVIGEYAKSIWRSLIM